MSIAEIFYIVIYSVNIFLAVIAAGFVFGIVWKTEGKLDHCYKFLAIAVVALLAKRLYILLGSFQIVTGRLTEEALETIFLVFFVLHIWKLRRLYEKISKE